LYDVLVCHQGRYTVSLYAIYQNQMKLKDRTTINNPDAPLISVCMITYNHRDFITEAIESVLMQEIDFDVEVLLHDDCSTDGTADIVLDYVRQYPNIFRPFLQKENQFNLGRKPIRVLLPNTRGDFLIVLEGDDAWIDPLQLHKQVAFLNNNPKFVLCYANARIVDACGKILADYTVPPENCRHRSQEAVIEFRAVMPTATVMFRNHPVLKRLPGNPARIYNGDVFLFAILAQYGPAGYVDISPSLYRHHSGGIFSSLDYEQRITLSMGTAKELHACIAPEFRPMVAGTIVRKYQHRANLLRTKGQRWKLVQNYVSLLLFSIKTRPFKIFLKDLEYASRVVAKSFLRDRRGVSLTQ